MEFRLGFVRLKFHSGNRANGQFPESPEVEIDFSILPREFFRLSIFSQTSKSNLMCRMIRPSRSDWDVHSCGSALRLGETIIASQLGVAVTRLSLRATISWFCVKPHSGKNVFTASALTIRTRCFGAIIGRRSPRFASRIWRLLRRLNRDSGSLHGVQMSRFGKRKSTFDPRQPQDDGRAVRTRADSVRRFRGRVHENRANCDIDPVTDSDFHTRRRGRRRGALNPV